MPFHRQAFEEMIAGDLSFARTLVELYKTEWPKMWKSLQLALEQGEAHEIEEAAHKLGGSLKNFFANEITGIAKDIEESAHQGETHGLEEKAQQMRPLLEQLEVELERSYPV